MDEDRSGPVRSSKPRHGTSEDEAGGDYAQSEQNMHPNRETMLNFGLTRPAHTTYEHSASARIRVIRRVQDTESGIENEVTTTRTIRFASCQSPAWCPISVSAELAYLISTVPPAPSTCSLSFSASSFGMASFRAFGALSTTSLACLRPSPVRARTTLMTAILLSP